MKLNPAPPFGSKERRKFFGSQEGGSRSGAKADKKKRVLSTYRKAQGKKAQASAGKALFDSPEMKTKMKAHAVEQKALARILGPTGRTHAVKIAKAHGTFKDADVLAFLRSGWTVKAATTVPAKVGAALGPLEPFELALNPGPDFAKVLGPKGEARAILLTHPRAAINAEVVGELREAGYDVSPAPKGAREGAVKVSQIPKRTNPNDYYHIQKITTALADEMASRGWKIHGFHADESDSSTDYYSPAYWSGWATHAAYPGLTLVVDRHSKGGRDLRYETRLGTCERCQGTGIPKGIHPAGKVCAACHGAGERMERQTIDYGREPFDHATPKRALWHLEQAGEIIAKGHAGFSWNANRHGERNQNLLAVEKLADRITKAAEKASPKASKTTKPRAESKPKPKPKPKPGRGPAFQPGLFGTPQAHPAEVGRLAFNPTGQKRPRAATAKARGKQPGTVKKAKAPDKATRPQINPTSEGALAKVWKAWTGADPGQVTTFRLQTQTAEVPGGRITLPPKVALLGRVAKLITKSGQLQDFQDQGPLMVTDAAMKRVFLLHPKGLHFDVEPCIIAYLAKKPKFGDKGLVEYVHAFERRTRAVMAGQIGALTGGFRLTPSGIEG